MRFNEAEKDQGYVWIKVLNRRTVSKTFQNLHHKVRQLLPESNAIITNTVQTQDMSRMLGGIKRALMMSGHSRSMSTYHMKDGTNYIIRAAGVTDYLSVIKLQVEELRKDVSDMKLLQDAQVLADRCRGGYQCLVAVGKSPDDKVKDEVLYGTIGLELSLNAPKKFDTAPLEEEWQSDLTADAYVDCLVVRAWARRNGIATNLMECAKRLAVSKGMKRIFMHGQE